MIWLITGTSSGFGYRLASIALSRGDRVLATARSLPKLQKLVDVTSQDPDQTKKDRLKTFRLDLGDSEKTIQDTVREAANVWGRIDVLVNNAGWGATGLAEEFGLPLIQQIINDNVMGTAKVTFATLPFMRAQKSGTVVTVGSRSVWKTERPGIGPYAMAKAALHAFTENLSVELAQFNIRTLLVEPGSFRTEGIYAHGWISNDPSPDYDDFRTRAKSFAATIPGNEGGDPDKAMNALADIVRGEGVAQGREWPKYLILGKDADRDVREKCGIVLNALDEWKDVSRNVSFDDTVA
ncbi:hypothetical protein AGABI1DRAFT_76862 [Agaricus bisporus var. burnettii JB137-S8]|uniref:NAD(P)-binding protein n=2 Tax=Agaricus bisporus var. burnettii TaxID=192524 RepID=K5WR28_AGABU|nr:uncharacterized protein AGABI1DRAFT_76862 [Agaricus bisporus var. burnettii JB137-S8]EKM77831.1 hypothetical protein AGABI1DRAFT_76862 [Agaricus bisporus var. burnettii JB137-S8]KAF7760109.1 hypothetical protein Agabi119p4_10785 [Agaricus bisporus var. burnettii]